MDYRKSILMIQYIFLAISGLSCMLLLSACTPDAEYPYESQLALDLSEIEELPEELEGSLDCTVTYTPEERLCVTVRNDTELFLVTGHGEGSLYAQLADGQWKRVEPTSSPFISAVSYTTKPGEEVVLGVAGLRAPVLDAGNYKLVFLVTLQEIMDVADDWMDKGNVWIEMTLREHEHDFDLVVPFSVP